MTIAFSQLLCVLSAVGLVASGVRCIFSAVNLEDHPVQSACIMIVNGVLILIFATLLEYCQEPL